MSVLQQKSTLFWIIPRMHKESLTRSPRATQALTIKITQTLLVGGGLLRVLTVIA